MGRSSKRIAGGFLSTLVLASIAMPVVAAPAQVATRTGVGPGVARPVFQRFGPGAGGARFPRYRHGNGYLGAAGAGLATAAFAGGYVDGGYGYAGSNELPPGAVAPPEPPPIAPLPACPMIIKVGPGLDHPVQTRVIYGAPACN